MPEDAYMQIYRRFLAGEEDALEELIGLYREGLTLFILSIVADPFDAEEIMIDTFARLAIKGKQFEGRSSLKTYLYAIGRNLALRHLKRHKRDTHLPLTSNYAGPDNLEKELLQVEDNQQLYRAMSQLRPNYRDVLYLLYFEDMSYAEVGEVLRKTEKQIGDLAYRAKAALKLAMEREVTDNEK